jgi:hypothetical protein
MEEIGGGFMRRVLQYASVLILAALCAGSAVAQTSAAKNETPKDPEVKAAVRPTAAYKLEYSIWELEGGKRVNSRNYVVFITDDDRNASLRTASRVPAGPPSGTDNKVQYIEVSVDIRPRLLQRDGGLILNSSIRVESIASDAKELGNLNPALPVTRDMSAQSLNAVVIGKPLVIASMDDAASKRRYEVEVTVTKQ